MKTLLVTGGAGFIGSCFVREQIASRKYCIVNLDALTYAGNLENLKSVETNPDYTFIRGDILDRELLTRIFSEYIIDAVINFAAETHVDRSIENPSDFLNTNVLGTQALLEASVNSWKLHPDDKYSFEFRPGVRFVQVSTDEVYGALGSEGFFSETSPLLPNSPYSVSKASADLLVRSYGETFGLPVIITRCSNNYGPYQFPEKLIPLMINNCLKNKSLPVYGDGQQIRDWLHVSDHCAAIAAVLERGMPGDVYNIGGNNERDNLTVVRLILEYTGKPESLISYVKDRPGHDRRYAIDNTKVTSGLGWKPVYTFEEGLRETIKWYIDNQGWLEKVVDGSYTEYYGRMYG